MDLVEQLQSLRNQHKELLKEYGKLISTTENSIDLEKNNSLKKELANAKKQLKELRINRLKITDENQRLRLALKEQIINERFSILKISKEKLKLYFADKARNCNNRLQQFASEMKNQLQTLEQQISHDLDNDTDDFMTEIEKLSLKIEHRIRQREEQLAQERKKIGSEISGSLASLAKEQVDETTMQKRIKRNRIEMKFGLNWLNRIGVVLILIGLGVAASYSQVQMSNFLKSSLSFLLGIVFLIGGEILYRKGKNAFATGLLGGGIGILYSSVFYSHFLLKTINLQTGGLLLTIVTLLSILLSLRYNSKVVISLALAGGYLPFLAYATTQGISGNLYYLAMGYMLVLNITVLIISFHKKWSFINFLSFLLNMPALIFLVLSRSADGISMGYTFTTFLLYLATILSYPMRHRAAMKIWDIVLLASNTLVNAIIMFILFERGGLADYTGLLALVYCSAYIGLSILVKKKLSEQTGAMLTFNLTALTFAVLMIPFQFGVHWLSMGWLIEGMLLVVFGYLKKEKKLEAFGAIITLLCIGAFLYQDVVGYFNSSNSWLFNLKYLFISLALVLIFIPYQLDLVKARFSKNAPRGRITKAVKYFSLINFLGFLIYISNYIYSKEISGPIQTASLNTLFFRIVMHALIFAGFGLTISNIKKIYDKGLQSIASILYTINNILSFICLLFIPLGSSQATPSFTARFFSIAILIGYNCFTILSIRKLIIKKIKERDLSFELYPLSLSILTMGILTALMVIQLGLSKLQLVISFTYLALAIGSVTYGFWKKFMYVRIFGLCLTIFALAKLVFFDLKGLTPEGKVVAYIGFGLLLIALSYIYQKASAKIIPISLTEPKNE